MESRTLLALSASQHGVGCGKAFFKQDRDMSTLDTTCQGGGRPEHPEKQPARERSQELEDQEDLESDGWPTDRNSSLRKCLAMEEAGHVNVQELQHR